MLEKICVIGIMGAVASGKTEVSRIFEDLGAKIIIGDKIAHQVLEESNVREKLVQLWGDDLIEEEKIDRRKLGKIAFANRENLDQLEEIVHPLIIQKIKNEVSLTKQENQYKAIVLDMPLLYECNLHADCDVLVFVEACLQVRSRRVKVRGWKEGEIAKREKFQEDLQTKRSLAQYIINNGGTIEETIKQVSGIWQLICNC